MQKHAWRRMAREMFRLAAPESRREADRALTGMVTEYVAARGAGCVLGFAPMADEPDIRPFFQDWLEHGGDLAMPVWLGGRDMLLRRVRDWERDLRLAAGSGIWEPVDRLPEVRPEEIDLAVIPGRFFSESCRRMGRGAGCYDSLVRGRTMYRVGVAYDFQVFPDIPASGDDEDMDIVITPSRVIVNTNRNAACPTSRTR